MALSQIGQNGVEEFFETIFYGVAYDQSKELVKDMVKDVDNDLLNEALTGALSIVTSGVMFALMRKQEEFIDKVFEISSTAILALVGSDYAGKIKNKLVGKTKGVKLFKKLGLFKSSASDKIAIAQVVSTTTGHHFQADNSISSDASNLQTSTLVKSTMIEKEKLHQSVASSMADSFNSTSMLKLATKSFTSQDKTVLKKIVGKDSDISIEDMNKVADFMFIEDADGNINGLSEQMFSMLNGLGYIHK